MNRTTSNQRLYSVRRPVAAFSAGAAVAVLAGLVGLGGAEFRLPLLIIAFDLYPHRAVRINLLISFATLAAAAVARLGFASEANVVAFTGEIVGMLTGGMIAAWIGAGLLVRVPKSRIILVISVLLIAIAGLLVIETLFAGSTALALPHERLLRLPIALVTGLMVGAVSSLLGVAGGELIIPILIFIFGADIKAAGTASVIIATPIVLTGIARHWLAGRFRSRSMLANLVLPMSVGSAIGAAAGGYAAALATSEALRILLAILLGVSAVKLWRKRADRQPDSRGPQCPR